ncbi:hypothetical protein IIA16_04505 [bacterium]|nr:hypothetical protein [bacterium]
MTGVIETLTDPGPVGEGAARLPPVLTRWWAWCLVASGALLGLSFVGDLASAHNLGRELRETPLLPPLFLAAKMTLMQEAETALIIIGLAVLGGIGWRAERELGWSRRLAGAWLAVFVILAPALVYLLDIIAATIRDDPTTPLAWYGATHPLLEMGVFAPLLLWAWVASHKASQKREALKRALWLGGAAMLLAIGWLVLESFANGRLLARALFYGLPFGFLPAVVLLHHKPWRERAGMLGLALATGFFLVGGLATPQLLGVPGQREAMARLGRSAPAEGEGWTGDNLVSIMGLGPEKVAYEQVAAALDGYALEPGPLTPGPPAEGEDARDFDPSWRHDRANLVVVRERLRAALAANPTIKEASLYGLVTATDPLSTEADVTLLAALAGMFPDNPFLQSQLAVMMYARGETAQGDIILRRWQEVAENDPLPREELEPCEETENREGCPLWGSLLGKAMFRREWPVFSPPHEGSITIDFESGALSGLDERLLVAAIPLHQPAEPRRWLGDGGHGPWSPEGVVAYRPVAGGKALLAPLPRGRYALQLAYRDYLAPGQEVWVSGLPTEPIVLGPGKWDWSTTITLFAAEPVVAYCEDGIVRWPPYPGASSYRLDGWSAAGGLEDGLGSMVVEGESLADLSAVFEPGNQDLGWLRVVPLDDSGNPMALVLPLSQKARSLAKSRGKPMAEGCLPLPPSERATSP